MNLKEGGGRGYDRNSQYISLLFELKVLEQRERERNKDKEFCIDIGTQVSQSVTWFCQSVCRLVSKSPGSVS